MLEWEAMNKETIEEKREEKVADEQEDHQKEIGMKANEGEMLGFSGLQRDENAPKKKIVHSRFIVQNEVPLFPINSTKTSHQTAMPI